MFQPSDTGLIEKVSPFRASAAVNESLAQSAEDWAVVSAGGASGSWAQSRLEETAASIREEARW